MKTLLAVFSLTLIANAAHAVCNRPVDPKKVVVMMSFHIGSEEERGAREGACARGETILVLPTLSPEAKRVQSQIAALNARVEALEAQSENCHNDACYVLFQARVRPIYDQISPLSERMEALKPNYKTQLNEFIASSRANGTKVTSLILSGHDGGGHYYGDNGETNMAEISTLAKENPTIFSGTTNLMLMGCWSGTPDQVEQWRVIFPRLRVLGGFVGSAPASTRIAAGTYIAGLLRGEKNLMPNATRAGVQAMVNSVQNLNMITAGVYVRPSCDETNTRAPAYYYISGAQNENELPEEIRPGLNTFASADERSTACMRTFGGSSFVGTYDWNGLAQYFSGEREPENNNELRSLYSFLRNNENCFTEGTSRAPILPDQVLMLRFYQDVKKNINKYFKADLEKMYETIGDAIAAFPNDQLHADFMAHKKLFGPSLVGMSRKETLDQISKLTGLYEQVTRNMPYEQRRTDKWMQVQRTMQNIDTHLYRLQCLPPTWHEYVENETLSAPTCN